MWAPDALVVPDGSDFVGIYFNTVTPAPGREAFHLFLLGPDTKNFFEGRVGIGTQNPETELHVVGTLTATSKNFQIAHPVEPKSKVLVHSALEGPEIAVYYRGEARLVNGEATVALPAYFEALTRKDQRTIQLTPVGGFAPLYVTSGVEGGRFSVRTDSGSADQRFYWEVKAIRADVAPLVIEKPVAKR